MLVSEMTYNIKIWLIKKIHIFYLKKQNNFFTILKENVIHAYNYMLNQSGQHNL